MRDKNTRQTIEVHALFAHSDSRSIAMKQTRLRRPIVPTLGAIIERYVAEVSIKKKGVAAERSIARTWLSTRLAGRPVDRIRNTDLIEVRDLWSQQHAPSTVVRRLAFLSHVYTVLRKDWGWTSSRIQCSLCGARPSTMQETGAYSIKSGYAVFLRLNAHEKS